MTAQPGSAGTAGRNYRVPEKAGRHRAPPPPPNPPTAAWWTVAAAAAALVLACVVAIAVDVAPDARAAGVHGAQVPTVTRAQETAGPLEIPTIGASGAWTPPEDTTTAVRPVTVTQTPIRVRTPASTVQAATEALVTQDDPSEPTVTPPPQPVSEDQPAEPTPTSPAPSTTDAPEETPVTPEPTATTSADVTVYATTEVTG